MATNQTIENIEETSHIGLLGILKIGSIFHVLFKTVVSWISIIVAIIITVVGVKYDKEYLLITEIVKQNISFLPGILGFTIAGYSLVIAFIPEGDMLIKITEREDDSKYSYYQKMSAIFALNVIFQGASLIVAFLIYFIDFINLQVINIQLTSHQYMILNTLGLWIISYTFCISLLLIIQIIINIFNFSQTHHLFIVLNKINPKK